MRSEENIEERIQFGPFELRTKSGELLRDGGQVKLAPQPLKVLHLLVQRAGSLVSRSEIRDEIWGADTFVDFDKGLNLCVAQIREALDDEPRSPRYVETLPRRGYRFIGTVERSKSDARGFGANGPCEDDERAIASPKLRRTSRQSWIFGMTVATILLLGAIGLYLQFDRPGPIVAKVGTRTLLVLPFENLSNDPTQDYFSDGLTEEIITRLGSLDPEHLRVIARTTALNYKKSDKDIRQIASELNVDYVLEGSVRRDNGQIRIVCKLIRADNQTQVWGQAFDREEREILSVQNEVAAQTAFNLNLKFTQGGESTKSLESEEVFARPEAYDAYLKGRYLITKDTPEDLQRSISFFDQAITQDPGFAPSYAAQVEALVLLTDWTGSPADSNLVKAKSAALRAVDLAPSYAEGYAALGSVQFWLEWNGGEAEGNLRHAVTLNPNNPLTRLNYGRYLLARGDVESASREIEEALRLDPVSLLTTGISAYAYLGAGKFDRAIELSKRMLELEPKSWAAHLCLLRAYANKNDYQETVNVMRDMTKFGVRKPKKLLHMNNGDSKASVETEFRNELRNIEFSAESGDKVWTMHAAWLSTKLNQPDKAFKWLDRAFSERAASMLFLKTDPAWDTLRSDPRFSQLVDRVSF